MDEQPETQTRWYVLVASALGFAAYLFWSAWAG